MFEEVGERTGNGAIILDEPSIEIGETQKALEFLDRRGYGPILDGGYLPLVHFDALLVDVVTQEFDWRLMEGAFLCFKEQVILS